MAAQNWTELLSPYWPVQSQSFADRNPLTVPSSWNQVPAVKSSSAVELPAWGPSWNQAFHFSSCVHSAGLNFEFRMVAMMWHAGHPLTVFSSFSKASRASSYVQISSRHSRWMLPCFISSSKKLALRSRRSTEWAASAGRNTETMAEGGRVDGWREKKKG